MRAHRWRHRKREDRIGFKALPDFLDDLAVQPSRVDHEQPERPSVRPSRSATPGLWTLLCLMAETELAAELHDAAGLTPKQRALRFMESAGLSTADMARLMHVHPGTVKTQLHRARLKVQAVESFAELPLAA